MNTEDMLKELASLLNSFNYTIKQYKKFWFKDIYDRQQ